MLSVLSTACKSLAKSALALSALALAACTPTTTPSVSAGSGSVQVALLVPGGSGQASDELLARSLQNAARMAIGDLAGDLSGRRGHITGTDGRGRGMSGIAVEVPVAEVDDYQSRLKSLTAGQGSYSIEFSHYAPVPAQTQQKLMASHKTVNLDDE